MGQIFAGLTFTAVCLAIAIAMMRRGKAPRIAAIIMFVGGCGLVGSWFHGFATKVASVLPGALVGFVAFFCAVGFVLDCWGKQNHAGKGTAIIGFFVPLLLVVMPVSLFGIDPDELVEGVRDITQQSQMITTGGRN
ncbi:hypothetical protein AB0K21_42280 [Streptosporangium sp. NPDC049248]|uniref:hypothetical protein n=1 Tax=Streptosporangium sp. NPDC049248 TaxID=3155651 RepID=UPI003435FD77